ncbi:hypothetical protein CQ009_24105 [Pseudomonas sp. MYb2]|nr:hypothetical protein CQ025_24885 [Pseudomonas sp. MYb3]PRC30240.1 hypothetical protein CQ009_24105 [Pseudomonas sp. MYb2]
MKTGRHLRNLNPRSASRPGVLFFQAQIFQQHTRHFEDYDMTYATYYRYDRFFAWRFTSLRSGQPAASDRSPTGGKHTHVANTANCRTPQ